MKRISYLAGLLFWFVSVSVYGQDTLTLHFNYDRSDLSAGDKHKINKALERPVEGIRVIGYTDSDGDSAYNYELGLKRARSVQRYISGIVDQTNINIESQGENNPAESNDDDKGKASNRRALVVIYYSGIASTSEETTVNKVEDNEPELIKKEDLKVGKKIVLENLNFYGGEAIIVPESKPTLIKLLKIMKDNPTLKIRLEGHVCCSPPGEDGLDYSTGLYNLSESRAAAVRQFLIDNGIEPGRMSSRGLKGDHRLIQIEQTEEDRLKNRRVEMVILSF